jgi:hypothetical protein
MCFDVANANFRCCIRWVRPIGNFPSDVWALSALVFMHAFKICSGILTIGNLIIFFPPMLLWSKCKLEIGFIVLDVLTLPVVLLGSLIFNLNFLMTSISAIVGCLMWFLEESWSKLYVFIPDAWSHCWKENSCQVFVGTSVLLEVITTNQKYWLVLIMNSASVVVLVLLFFSVCG